MYTFLVTRQVVEPDKGLDLVGLLNGYVEGGIVCCSKGKAVD